MKKQLEPEGAIPASDFLNSIIADYTAEIASSIGPDGKVCDERKNAKGNAGQQISMHLFDLINGDVCLTVPQGRYIELLIMASTTSLVENKNIDYLVLPIVTYINSIRLSCRNCLNTECELRCI